MVPETAKKPIPRKCPICEKKLASKEALVNHIDKAHSSQIPEDWSASRYENYLRTGMTHGNCTECGEPTSWNDSTWKYNRLCDNPKCKEVHAKRMKNNMIDKHGKPHLLNDADMQRKMIYSKKTSGTYYWSTDNNKKYKIMYASKQEKNFLEMLDVFLNMDPADIMGPSPHTYTYKYEGEDHFYIPDYYIASLNLEVEIKEPKDNPNKHPKIQAVDKVKDGLKEDLMKSIKEINFIKIQGTDYSEFFAFLSSLKEMDDAFEKNNVMRGVIESINNTEVVTEARTLNDMVDRFNSLMNNVTGLANPKLNFDDVIDDLRRQIDKCRREDIPYLERQIVATENQLHEYSLRKPHEKNSENAYEAKKALKVLQNELKPRFEYRKRVLLESVIYMDNDIYDYKTTCFTDVTEAKVIKAVKDKTLYRPVFVVLSYTATPAGKIIKAVTKQPYTHACLSFDTTMEEMVSFNMVTNNGKRGGGFSPDESFRFGGYTNDGAYYAIYMYMATQDEYNTMEKMVDTFRTNINKLDYSMKGCINYLFNREKSYSGEKFCSEFVADILKSANPNLLKKSSNLYSPGDLATTRKLRCVDKGLIKDYNQHKVDVSVARVLKERGMQSVEIR